MKKTKKILLLLWIVLGISILIVNDKYYAEAIAMCYAINGFLDVVNKDYK
jgi:hypothetical protein